MTKGRFRFSSAAWLARPWASLFLWEGSPACPMAGAWNPGAARDPYDTLGISRHSTREEAKSRYRELVLECHPDRGGDEGRFMEVQEAYEEIAGEPPRARRGGPPRGETPHMEMAPVRSSNLVAVGYDPQTATLRVEFGSGTYDYYNVPERVHRALMSTGSKGAYHAAHIKWRYRYERVR